MNDFVLDKAVLSEEEKQEVLTALQSINTMQNRDSSRTLQKLSAMFNLHSENWLEVDFSRWGNQGTDNEKFELLKSAVIHQKCVKITYADSYGKMSERIVHPLKLAYKSMSWYLKAYCTQKEDYRIFKLTRIIDLEVLEEGFAGHAIPESDDKSGQENGDLIVSAKMPEDEWLLGYLLSFGTQVEIIEPAYLKKVVADTAKKIYEKTMC